MAIKSKGMQACVRRSGLYERALGVEVDPNSEVVVNFGSKEGLLNLANCHSA